MRNVQRGSKRETVYKPIKQDIKLRSTMYTVRQIYTCMGFFFFLKGQITNTRMRRIPYRANKAIQNK